MSSLACLLIIYARPLCSTDLPIHQEYQISRRVASRGFCSSAIVVVVVSLVVFLVFLFLIVLLLFGVLLFFERTSDVAGLSVISFLGFLNALFIS